MNRNTERKIFFIEDDIRSCQDLLAYTAAYAWELENTTTTVSIIIIDHGLDNGNDPETCIAKINQIIENNKRELATEGINPTGQFSLIETPTRIELSHTDFTDLNKINMAIRNIETAVADGNIALDIILFDGDQDDFDFRRLKSNTAIFSHRIYLKLVSNHNISVYSRFPLMTDVPDRWEYILKQELKGCEDAVPTIYERDRLDGTHYFDLDFYKELFAINRNIKEGNA